ncbi:hypothetical protein TRVA0_017S00342 [Trichomonascus vanleenenianus]|uniref:PCI domain-containing protein n=1 Tax=Trichomonascus vanleenenianus TaxID=2268995 RepID=UPI003ECB2EB4
MDQILSLYHSVESNISPSIAIDLIKQAIRLPRLYAFSELRDPLRSKFPSPDSSLQQWFDVLDLFAYGTWADYKAKAGGLPGLDEASTKKLKQLSLVTIASSSRLVEYQAAAAQLDIDASQLEQFMLDAILAGLLTGKLDTKRQIMEVRSAIGRDVSGQRLEEIESQLDRLVGQSEGLLSDISQVMEVSRTTQRERSGVAKEYSEINAQQLKMLQRKGARDDRNARE